MEIHKKNFSVDYIVGASAGAFMACYFLADNASKRSMGYWEIDTKKHFNYLRNVWKYKSLFFYEYLLRDMFLHDNPIDNWDTILQSKLNIQGKFCIQIFDALSGKILLLRNFQTKDALLESIIASCWLPILGGMRPFTINSNTLKQLEVTDTQGHIIHPSQLQKSSTHTYKIAISGKPGATMHEINIS